MNMKNNYMIKDKDKGDWTVKASEIHAPLKKGRCNHMGFFTVDNLR